MADIRACYKTDLKSFPDPLSVSEREDVLRNTSRAGQMDDMMMGERNREEMQYRAFVQR